MKTKGNIFKKISLFAVAFCLAAGAGIGAAGTNSFGAFADEDTSSAAGQRFYADYNSKEEVAAAGQEVNKQIMAEGITLLKNDDGVLPLKKTAKVSVFGKRSVQLIANGAGSGSSAGGTTLSVNDSLEMAGITINPELEKFYKDTSLSGSFEGGLAGYQINAGKKTGETPYEKYTSEVKSSYKDYNDAAFVVIGRYGAESADLPKSMSSGFNSDGSLKQTSVDGKTPYTNHYLQLDANEEEMLKEVNKNFDNVIVVLNTGSQFQLDFLGQEGYENIKGVMWVGYQGAGEGFESFGKLVTGEITPSGKTVDTYARDFKKDPTWYNMSTLTNNNHFYSNNSNYAFVDYEEGIYVGYRYYETRGYTDGEDWYKDNVVYPFGYGLSYTTFDWDIKNCNLEEGATLEKNGGIDVTVTVTNTGKYAGKDVVQLYYTPPYKAGGIEKSHVVLSDFAKTRTLQPGESQDVTLSLTVQSMASYDYNDLNKNGHEGYDLDGGNYEIKIMRDAHTVEDSLTFKVPDEGYIYTTDEDTGAEVKNRFDYVTDARDLTFLSRNDWDGTMPQSDPSAADRVMTDAIAEQIVVDDNTNDDEEWFVTGGQKPWYTTEMPEQKEGTTDEGDIKLFDLYGKDYDDPMWEQFLSQFTVGGNGKDGTQKAKNGLTKLLLTGAWQSAGFDGLGIPETYHFDGPSGINDKAGGSFTNFANEVCTASTWNTELAYQKGLIIGNEALFGSSTYQLVSGFYAPAVNLHRSPFGGRNFEYFSEDGVLSGRMAAEIVKGCNEKGVITWLKHFAVNDLETARDKLNVWANEQSMRELYFKPFEICVKEGDTHGIMSALNYLGGVWCGGNYMLQTEVLRGEWGFDGAIITDYLQSRPTLRYDQSIRTGGDFFLVSNGGHQNNTINGLDSPTTVASMRRAAHNLLYTMLNYSNIYNRLFDEVEFILDFKGGTVNLPLDSEASETDQRLSSSLKDGSDASAVTYKVVSGQLPEGLTLNPDGTFSGVVKQKVKNCIVEVEASYGGATSRAEVIINIVNGDMVYTGRTLADAVIGEKYEQDLSGAYIVPATEEAVKFTYKVANGSILPDGLTLSEDGVLSGTPLKFCKDYTFSVTAYAEGYDETSAQFTVSALSKAVYAGGTLEAAHYNRSYTTSVAGDMPGAVYSLENAEDFPAGLTLTSNGTIVGTPTSAGTYTFTVIAKSDESTEARAEFTLTVGLVYPAMLLDDAAAGTPYEIYVNNIQGAGEATYALKEGSSLPEGLTLSSDGIISGTPAKAGNYTFTIVATSGGISDEATFSLFVAGDIVEGGGCAGALSGGNALLIGGALALAAVAVCRKRRTK